MKKNLGFIGWRGMVGSVLLNRMIKKKDIKNFNIFFFSTSQKNKKINFIKNLKNNILQDAYSIKKLMEMNIILTCQGSLYTNKMYNKLQKLGWSGYWVDAASDLRLSKNSLIVLDPLNRKNIETFLNKGGKTLVGGNCTVSLMLLALGGLFKEKLIKWISVNTYQAASGGGAHYLLELFKQFSHIYQNSMLKSNTFNSVLDIEKNINDSVLLKNFPKDICLSPLSMNLIPWIDSDLGNGQSKEEWKIEKETNKILYNNNKKKKVLIDGTCVRISSLRCHSQSFLIKLKKNIFIQEIEEILRNHNKWVRIIKNKKSQSIKKLNPMVVSGKLSIPVGRLRKLNIGNKYLSAFSVGDQLLWGAAEPLRRVLKFLK